MPNSWIDTRWRGNRATSTRLPRCSPPTASITTRRSPSSAGTRTIAKYWERTKLQSDIHLDYEILSQHARGGVAHWHVTYQVTSEDLFRIWAASTGTNALARKPGDPLPRLALDGVAVVEMNDAGLCRDFRLWWHSVIA